MPADQSMYRIRQVRFMVDSPLGEPILKQLGNRVTKQRASAASLATASARASVT